VKTDVCVIGGGPAGLAVALAARRHGLDVVLADRARPPIDKACGEGLMPDGVAALRELGINPDTGVPFRGIRFLEGGSSAQAAFSKGSGLGIRRIDLHRLLLAKTEDAGVVTRWGAPVEDIRGSTAEIGGQMIRFRWIVGADGLQSRVRLRAGLPPAWSGARRIGLRQHFRITPWTDFVEVYWRPRAQAYVTPVGPNEVCVAVLGDPRSPSLTELALFPELAKRLGKAVRTGPMRGAISVSARLGAVARDPFVLVGDASGAVDAITGEGLSLALRQAVALGRALVSGDFASYRIAHTRMSRMPLLAGRLLLNLGSHDELRRRTLQVLGAYPQTFERLLAIHIGTGGLASSALGIVGFALQLLGSSQPIPSSATRLASRLSRRLRRSPPAMIPSPSGETFNE